MFVSRKIISAIHIKETETTSIFNCMAGLCTLQAPENSWHLYFSKKKTGMDLKFS